MGNPTKPGGLVTEDEGTNCGALGFSPKPEMLTSDTTALSLVEKIGVGIEGKLTSEVGNETGAITDITGTVADGSVVSQLVLLVSTDDVTTGSVIAVLVGGTTGVGVPVTGTTPDGPTSTIFITVDTGTAVAGTSISCCKVVSIGKAWI